MNQVDIFIDTHKLFISSEPEDINVIASGRKILRLFGHLFLSF